MCRFKSIESQEFCDFYDVSIHHMCRFKFTEFMMKKGDFSFNTSYVSVQESY